MISPERILFLLQEHEILPEADHLQLDSNLFLHGLDSMALMQLLIQIEAVFGIAIQPADITKERFTSPNTLAGFLSAYDSTAIPS